MKGTKLKTRDCAVLWSRWFYLNNTFSTTIHRICSIEDCSVLNLVVAGKCKITIVLALFGCVLTVWLSRIRYICRLSDRLYLNVMYSCVGALTDQYLKMVASLADALPDAQPCSNNRVCSIPTTSPFQFFD